MTDRTIAEYLDLADHYKAIGHTDIIVFNDPTFPFAKADMCEAGGSIRLNITTSYRFSATIDGLRFTTYVDLEPPSANGSGSHQIDVGRVRYIKSLLPDSTREQFSALLAKSRDQLLADLGDARAYVKRLEDVLVEFDEATA